MARSALEVVKHFFESLENGDIFKFPYSYRGGLVADSGFLIQGEDKRFYLLVGDELDFDFIELKQLATPVADEEVDEDEFMSFDMI